MSFMAANRIKWLGYLSTRDILRAGETMDADLVLLGTVIRNKRSASYGLILNLVRTRDARTVWASSGGLSLGDIQSLLGLNQPATVKELWPYLVDDVLASWPDDLSKSLTRP